MTAVECIACGAPASLYFPTDHECKPHLQVRKIAHVVPVQVDTDGTPLWMGERMVEVAPGEWMTPLAAGLAASMAEQATMLDNLVL